jgi:hypothetical protein
MKSLSSSLLQIRVYKTQIPEQMAEPSMYHEAVTCNEATQWRKAKQDEINSIIKNKT